MNDDTPEPPNTARYRAGLPPHPQTPAAACRVMNTRPCPAVYAGPCGDRPCARFESDDSTPWLDATTSPAPADPDKACPHMDFEAAVEVNRLTATDDNPAVIGYSADIKVRCANCGELFRWIGVPAGMSPRKPMCGLDETELHAPLRPASADPDFGLGIPGFAINYRPGPDDSTESSTT